MSFDPIIAWLILVPIAFFLYVFWRNLRARMALQRARVGRDQGDMKYARLWAQRAIDRATTELERAVALDEMGGVHRFMGANDKAEKCYREALQLRKWHLPLDHGDIGGSLHNVGLSCFCAGRFEEAESYFRQALNSLRAARGAEDPSVALTSGLLGMACMGNGKLMEATELSDQSLRATEQLFGSEAIETAEAYQRQGDCAVVCGRAGAADRAYLRSFEILGAVKGARHPTTLVVLQQRAFLLIGLYLLLSDSQALVEADKLVQQYIAGTSEELGPEHHLTAGALITLGRLRTLQNRSAEALEPAREGLRILTAVIGPEHVRTAHAHLVLAQALAESGQLAEAEQEAQCSLAINVRALGVDHFETGDSLQFLGQLAARQGRYVEAENFLQRNLTVLTPLGPKHPNRAFTLRELAIVREATGRPDEAKGLRQEEAEIIETVQRERTCNLK